MENEDDFWTGVEYISTLRSDMIFDRALLGLDITLDEAVEKIKATPAELSEQEKEERDIIIAAYENLTDFSVAETYTMMKEIAEGYDEDMGFDNDDIEKVSKKFMFLYADTENLTVFQSALIAKWMLSIQGNQMITYMTQRDERVRDTHAILDGLTYRKSEFPQELIPPIEFGCRCYLVADDNTFIQASIKDKINQTVNPVFKESLSMGGRIFSDEHSYFKKSEGKKDILEQISKNIKQSFYEKEFNI